MDIFKFNSPTEPTRLEHGEIVNGLNSKMWIERYRTAGEFTFRSHASAGIKEKLPTGTLISHVDTTEVMIVENHEIVGNRDKEAELITTGRGFETFFENRNIAWAGAFPEEVGPGGQNHFLNTDEIWDNVVQLIEDYVVTGHVDDPDNAVPFLEVFTALTGTVDARSRIINQGSLYSRLLELLKIGDLGIKIVRPGTWSPLGPTSPNTAIEVHKGVDRSDEIIFSYDTGEIESADYLWSIKSLKNAAVVTGRWIQTVYAPTETGYGRRMMEIDGSSVDGHFAEVPIGTDLTNVVNAMHQLAIDTLAAQKELDLTKAEVSRSGVKTKYRHDYDVGDLVTVSGEYNSMSTMRIEEYVEIEDERGSSGYPTLAKVS